MSNEENVNVSIAEVVATSPRIWKISGAGVFSEEQRDLFIKKNIVVVHGDTGKNQGENFISSIHAGDLFYLCHGNNIKLFGRFTTEKAAENNDMGEAGWYERSYEKLFDAVSDARYEGKRYYWSPSGNSTCWMVPEDELGMFEEQILQPYFGKKLIVEKSIIPSEENVNENVAEGVATSPRIWKFSHGTGVFSEEQRDLFIKKNIVVINGDTGKNQGENFISSIHAGDLFYLCHGNNIKLFGRFTTEKAVENNDMGEAGWYERSYEKLFDAVSGARYEGKRYYWSPSGNSTCWMVPEDELGMFEEKVLQPYFGKKLSDLEA